MDLELDESEYKITTAGYLQRVHSLQQQGGLANLFYAAFELRCALERTMIDFLVLSTSPIAPEQYIRDGQYKPRAVLGIIRNSDPEFEKRLHFTRLIMLANGIISSNIVFDFEWVCDSHDLMNGYLHHQKDPIRTTENPVWVSEFWSNVGSIAAKLLEMWKSNKGYLKEPSSAGDQVWELFRSGKYADEEIIRMLRLSDLPESMRA